MAAMVCSIQAWAQMGAAGANFGGGLDKLFDGNPVFTANMITTISGPNGPMNIKTKMYFDHGNSRTDMNMSDAQGGGLPPAAISWS